MQVLQPAVTHAAAAVAIIHVLVARPRSSGAQAHSATAAATAAAAAAQGSGGSRANAHSAVVVVAAGPEVAALATCGFLLHAAARFATSAKPRLGATVTPQPALHVRGACPREDAWRARVAGWNAIQTRAAFAAIRARASAGPAVRP
eukprot:356459-Chlamydomonas_euryale.AAC.1